MYQRLIGSANGDMDMSWLCSHGATEETKNGNNRGKTRWLQKTRESAARSKTALWGPSHSLSSDDSDETSRKPNTNPEETKMNKNGIDPGFSTPPGKPVIGSNSNNNNSQDTASTKSSNESTPPTNDEERRVESMGTMQSTLGRVWNNLQCFEDTTANSTEGGGKEDDVMNLLESVCSPCKPRNLGDAFSVNCEDTPLGIARLAAPNKYAEPTVKSNAKDNKAHGEQNDEKSTNTVETAADRRRQRHKRRQLGTPRLTSRSRSSGEDASPHEAYEVTPDQVMLVQRDRKNSSLIQRPLPLKSLELNCNKAVELERCISELTMRSSYGEATAKIAESRRMAYYAVGRHHRQSGRGGNRRCYFTGKLILGGAPFYAGSVQQGLRTLVVFCLPSAVGLPKEVQGNSSHSSRAPTMTSLGSGRRSNSSNRFDGNASVSHSLGVNGNSRSVAGASLLSRKNSRGSRLSSIDDATSLGCSVEEELDPNWELDREYLLRVLPEPNQELLDQMAIRYPTQFETLPVQVRSPPCWNLYVKFCFFSGLPIAEGEMHYKVRVGIADRYGEEINLSHEVMEAVNGDSAEILRLPNLKTFRYLRKHYHQQSAKLPDNCFQRQTWEMVRPEV